MVQHLIGLGPQLPRRIGRERGQLGPQLLQRPAQTLAQHGRQLRVACRQRIEGTAVGEREHRPDELIAVPHRRRGQIDRHRAPVLRPQHLPAHPVLAPRGQRVVQRRLLEGQRRSVGPRMLRQRMQLLAAELARPVPEDLRRGRIHQHNPARGVDADHTLGSGPQDHLRLPLLAHQLGLRVQGVRQIAHHQDQQLLTGVVVGERGLDRGSVRRMPRVEPGAGHLDRQLGAVRAPGDHARRPRPDARVLLRAAHRAGDTARVELRHDIEQPAADERGARSLQGLHGDGVGVDDGAVAVDEQQRVGQRVEYGGEASSAPRWPAAHDVGSSLDPRVQVHVPRACH